MSALSTREILFVLKMQNQTSRAIKEMASDLASISRSLDSVDKKSVSTRGPKKLAEGLKEVVTSAVKATEAVKQTATEGESGLKKATDATKEYVSQIKTLPSVYGPAVEEALRLAGATDDIGESAKVNFPTITGGLLNMQKEGRKASDVLAKVNAITADLANAPLFEGTDYAAGLDALNALNATGLDLSGPADNEHLNVIYEARAEALEVLRQRHADLGLSATSSEAEILAAAQISAASLEKLEEEAKKAGDEVGNIGGPSRLRGLLNMKNLIIGAVAALAGNAVVKEADAWKRLTGQLRLVSTSESNLLAVRQKVVDIAKETFSDLEATGQLYARVAQRADILGLSQEEVAKTVENVSIAMQVGGSTAEEAAGALRQFSQALGRGELRGDELNSIIENSPGLAKAFEDGLREAGKEVRSLKQYIDDAEPAIGELLEALESQGPKLREQFESLPRTVGQGMTFLKTSITEFIGKVDEASKATDGIANFLVRLGTILTSDGVISAFSTLANIIGGVLNAALTGITTVLSFLSSGTTAAKVALTALAAVLTIAAWGLFETKVRKITKAVVAATKATWAWTVALLKNPIVLVAALIVGAVTALYLFRDSIKFSGDEAYTLGEVVRGVFLTIKEWVVAVAEFFKDLWAGNIDSISEKFGAFAGFVASILRLIMRYFKFAINSLIKAWQIAFTIIGTAWSNFPDIMYNIFAAVVNLAGNAAEAVLNSWQIPLRLISDGLKLIGGDGGLGEVLDAVKFELPKLEYESAGIPEMLEDIKTIAASDPIGDLINGLGAKGRANPLDEEPGSLSTESGDPTATAGDPTATAGDTTKENERKKAMDALKDRVKEINEATKAQLEMNAAIEQGPRAVRELNVVLAGQVELREQLKALDAAGVDITENSPGYKLAQAAAEAAKNGELAKQAEEMSNLNRSLTENVRTMREQQMVAEQVAEAGLSMSAATARASQFTFDYNDKLKELTKGYTDAERATDANGKVTAEYAEKLAIAKAAAQEYAESLERIRHLQNLGSLVQAGMTDMQHMANAYDNARESLERFGHKLSGPELEAAQRAVDRLRPPEDIFDALQQGLRSYMDELEPSLLKVADLAAGVFSKVGDTIADMVLTGKANFGELARSIIADITAMIIKALIFKTLMSLFGGSPVSALSTDGGVTGAILNTRIGHSGGIVGAAGRGVRGIDPGVFAAARKYHSGGLAGVKGLTSGEIPVIAKRNEAILPTVRLPDGNFGVKADMGGGRGGGGGVFAPQYNIQIGGDGASRAGDLPPEMQAKLGAMLEEELNVHMQRKLDEWTRPGGQLSVALKRR